MTILSLIFIFVLILISAFFVAAEFAIVKVRKSRMDELTNEGHKHAMSAKKILSQLDIYLSTCQLGITLTSLGIGWLGEPTVERLLHPFFQWFPISENISHTISFCTAFLFITFFHVVLGELVPKSFAIQKSETVTLLFAKPLMGFHRVMSPFIWFLNTSASFVTKGLGLSMRNEHENAHSEEELRLLVNQSYQRGEINDAEYRYVNNIFTFDNRLVQHIMIPRNEIVCVSLQYTEEENRNRMVHSPYTRYPVIENSKDRILGMIHLKDLFQQEWNGERKPLQTYIQPLIPIFEKTPIQQALFRLQQKQAQMALVVDEYGGTAGIITMEDILEEIVGEIQDEFDTEEPPMIQPCTPELFSLNGKALLAEVNVQLGLSIPHQEVDTLGGWILLSTVELPVYLGYTVEHENFRFKVLEVQGNQIKRVAAIKSTIPISR
ncbi:hemolysin family protein [Bacillus thuringiensis]|uniref:hemolysin family protein n=1 Tax=Bacillus thuringiensis TaxID=1428 RepID=UPI003B97DF87